MRERASAVKENRIARYPVFRHPLFYAVVLVSNLVVIFVQLVRLWDPLAVVDVTWTRVRENEGVVAFELKNWAPVSLRVNSVMELYPLPKSVMIGSPQALAPDGGEVALPDPHLGPWETLRVSVPVIVTPDARVNEIQLAVWYEVLGFWKIAKVQVSNLDL